VSIVDTGDHVAKLTPAGLPGSDARTHPSCHQVVSSVSAWELKIVHGSMFLRVSSVTDEIRQLQDDHGDNWHSDAP
jgi:hypothetical protein